MPNQPGSSVQRRIRTVIHDVHGEPILATGMGEVIIFGPNNQIIRQRDNENIQLVCGSIYNPAMSMGQNPVMLISVCERCRAPRTSLFSSHVPTHGLCSTAAGALCHNCGTFLCPRHVVRCDDGNPRCERCVRWYKARGVLRSIFFKPE